MFRSLLPKNSTDLERALERSAHTRFEDLNLSAETLGQIWSPEHCPLELLPFLAWALSVDVWNTNWSEAVKRQVVANSVFVHRHKGTRAGIDAALSALDLGVSISEWFEHGGEPYTFRADVSVTGRGISQAEIKDIFAVIAASKNARSHLERLRVYLSNSASVYHAQAMTSGSVISIGPYVPKIQDQSVPQHHASFTSAHSTISIGVPS